jgi:hypothetical protein
MAKANFFDSAKRHFHDAELLESNNRMANAGQLYGFCAECGIKALSIALGYPVDDDGSPEKKPPAGAPKIRKHINELASIRSQLDAYVSGRGGAKYLALVPNIHAFEDWSVDYRYYDQQHIPSSLPSWKAAAIETRKMLDAAFVEGVLT